MDDRVKADEEMTVELLVCVSTFGKRDRMPAIIETEARQVLERAFGERVAVLAAPVGCVDEVSL